MTQENNVAKWEERMKPVLLALPTSVHEVGYISDNESSAIIQEYMLTKYALVPVVVRQGVKHEWIVGNFTQPGFEKILDKKISTSYTIKKFGAGIYLIQRVLP